MTLSLPLRRRAASAGVLEPLERVLAGAASAEDLHALVGGPLPLLASAAAQASGPASIVGVVPGVLGADVAGSLQRILAHRAAPEAEVVELCAPAPCATGALDLACELVRRALVALPGATARVDLTSLLALAEGSHLEVAGAAARLHAAGVTSVLGDLDAPATFGPLPVLARADVPEAIDLAFVRSLGGPPRALLLRASARATGITLLRAVALARLAGHRPVTLRADHELKGPDGALAFGADVLEAELDPPGTLGARTRDYGEAAVRGSQRQLAPARRRAPEGSRVARILDEHVPAGLDGAVSLHVVAPEASP